MKTNFTIYFLQSGSYQTRTRKYRGRKHLVVPVVMMVEGVHNGSAGAVFHSKEELSKFVEAWNGRPVTIDHPQQDGMDLSASETPEVSERSVGLIFHTRMDDGKLKAEAWLDELIMQEVSSTALAYIKQNRPLDVSVGVFSDSDPVSGEWNGETYVSVARNYRPDHLALLPGGTGACSWNDGCGVRTNKEGGTSLELLQTLKDLNRQGYAVSLIDNKQGYLELMNLLRSKIDGMDNDLKMHFLTEVYDDHVIYEIRRREQGDSYTLYKQNYQLIDQNTKVDFVGDPVEVRRNVEYITMSMRRIKKDPQSINNNDKIGGNEMGEEKKTPCCLAKVEQLISNKLTHFSDADKEWLLTQEEGLLDKLFPIEQKPEPAPVVNKDKALEVLSTQLKTVEDYVAIMPKDIQDQVNVGLTTHKEQRDAKIQSIMDNSGKDVWTKEELKVMTDAVLDKISKTTKAPVDYSGLGGGNSINTNKEEPLLPVGVETKK